MFKELINSKVTLVKQNGEEYKDIPACVQTKTILFDDVSIPIEEGDYIIRQLPNGLIERYLVLDRGYYEKFLDIDAHYQVKVQKETTRKLESKTSNSYNISGTNNKINIQSIDNSVNIIGEQYKEVFDNIRNIIRTQIQDESLIVKVNEMESNVGKSSFKDSYNKFIMSAANHMTILSPFIPILTDILAKSI